MPENRFNGKNKLEFRNEVKTDKHEEGSSLIIKVLGLFDKLQQRIGNEVLLFALAYLLLIIVIIILRDRIVVELKVVLTLLPLFALIVYTFTIDNKKRSETGKVRKEKKASRSITMGSNMPKDRDQYEMLLGYLNKLTETQFLDVKQYLLTVDEINTSSGTSRVHFMSDMRVAGKMNELEKYLLDKYHDRLFKK